MLGIERFRGVIDSRWRIDPPARSVLIGASVLALCLVPIRSDTFTASWASPVAAPLASDPVVDPGPRPEEVYVPNSATGSVDVIDPATYTVVAHYAVGPFPHHVAPAWDLHHLYIDTEGMWSLTVIDPMTTRVTGRIPVSDPYNLYFTPDGTMAVVVAERLHRLDFYDPHTWQVRKSVFIPWLGVDHLDFTADGRYLLASTEYSGVLVKVDLTAM